MIAETPQPEVGQTPNDYNEPNFDDWVESAQYMHQMRRQIMARAISVEEISGSWSYFAEELAGYTYPDSRESSIIVLSSLLTQGYLELDLENPHVIRTTETGRQWHSAQSVKNPG